MQGKQRFSKQQCGGVLKHLHKILFKDFFYYFTYVCMCVGIYAHERKCPERSEVSHALELELLAGLSRLMWVLGIKALRKSSLCS